MYSNMTYSKYKKHHLYFNVLKSADCPCKCLFGVIRTIGGIETDARSHQKFHAAIHNDPRRSAAIRGDPRRSAATLPHPNRPLGSAGGTPRGKEALSRLPCASAAIRTDPNPSEPIRTDPNRPQLDLQPTPSGLLCPFPPPPSVW